MRLRRLVGQSLLGIASAGLLLPVAAAGTAQAAANAANLQVCTAGFTFTINQGAVHMIGQGSCVGTNARITPVTFTGAGVPAAAALCIGAAPIVAVPNLTVTVTLSPPGLLPTTSVQQWTAPTPLGSPLYAATISGADSPGVVAAASLSGSACQYPLTVQGPMVLVFFAQAGAPIPSSPPTTLPT